MEGSTFLIVRGLVGLVVGVLAIAWPAITIAVMVGIFAAYAIVDGLANLILGFTRTGSHGRSWALVLQGAVGIAVGVLTFIWPAVTTLVLVMFIAAWAIITGVLEIAAALRLHSAIKGAWMLGVSGTFSVLLGVLVFLFPAAGALGLAWLIGGYAVASGAVLLALGVQMRSHLGEHTGWSGHHAHV